MKTPQEKSDELREAKRALLYAFYKSIGVIWLARKMFVELKDWVEEREARKRAR
jgi:hypothetical protein